MILSERIKAPLRSVLSLDQRRRVKTLLSPLYRRDLSQLALLFGTDKQGSHYYTQHYQQHFEALRRKPLNILEVGVGG